MKRLPRKNLQRTIDLLTGACGRAHVSVDELLARPLTDIVRFAQGAGIRLEDMRDICELLIQRLDELDVEAASFQHLTFLDPTHTATGARSAVPLGRPGLRGDGRGPIH